MSKLTDDEGRVGKGEVEQSRASHPFCFCCVMLKVTIMMLVIMLLLMLIMILLLMLIMVLILTMIIMLLVILSKTNQFGQMIILQKV